MLNYYQRKSKFGNMLNCAAFNGIEFIKHGNYYVNNNLGKRLHVYIFEQYYNCSILKGVHIHHIDFNPDNNDINNLQLLFSKEHYKLHNQYRNFGTRSQEQRKNISEGTREAMINIKLPQTGTHLPQDRKNKISNTLKGKMVGNKNPIWIEPTKDIILDFKNKIKRKDFIAKYNSRAVWDKLKKQYGQ